MSWQDDAMIEQERANALFYMGEAEWREMMKDETEYNTFPVEIECPRCRNKFNINLKIDKELGDFELDQED